MAENKCPICQKTIEEVKFSDWIKRWGADQWNSPELRRLLISEVEDVRCLRDKIAELEPLCEKQARYIKELEKQLELLQRTLDIMDRIAPIPTFREAE